MTKLIGIKMQGIRSIDEEAHVINFLDPLTIIQGENGTGKTTIIEALSYIATGALPSGRLGSFIHNNKLSKKKRVDALIQLQFIDFRGDKIAATKRMYAAQSGNKDKITTKSEEFTIKTTKPNGKTRSESAKVGDFNHRMEDLFGVPAAILQHVIFCHQEDSTWPLAEPKELKTKFDAIFEVEKFVKVMDATKKCAKEFEAELKVISTELPHLQRHMQQLGVTFMQLEETSEKIEHIRGFLKRKEVEKTNLEAEFKVLRKEAERVAAIERNIELKQTAIETSRNTIAGILGSAGYEQYKGTKAELIKELNALKKSGEFVEISAQQDKAREEMDKLEAQIPGFKSQMKSLQDKINSIEGRRLLVESQQAEREKIIHEGIKTLRLKVEPSGFADALASEINKAEAGLKVFLDGKDAAREELNKKKIGIAGQIVTHTNTDKMKRAECSKLKDQISRLEMGIKESENSDDKNIRTQAELAARYEEFTKLQTERTEKTDTLKQALFGLDVYPNVMTEFGDVEVMASRFDNLYIAQNKSFKDFIRDTAGEKAVLSENIRRDLNERKTQYEEAQQEMRQALQSMQPLKVEQKALDDQLKSFTENTEKERLVITQRINLMKNTAKSLKDVESKLEGHHEETGTTNIEEYRQRLMDAEKKLEDSRAEIERWNRVINECANQSQKVQVLESRLSVFDAHENIARVEKEIAELKNQVTRPSKEIHADSQAMAKKVNEVSNEMNQKLGSKDTLKRTVKELRNQLKGEQIEEAKKKLKQKVIERVSTEAAIQDLRNLAKVMDDSIIQYHSQKMEQINSILSDMWPRVYQGNDIETIQIRSQPVEGTEKRKSYDYSVIMVVDQVEIEMRDRCSAGQKIENMGAILKDLLDACQNRENHHNLQLIVITHDKRLVEHLFTACRPDYVYGLSKDESGISRIRIHHSVAESANDQEDS